MNMLEKAKELLESGELDQGKNLLLELVDADPVNVSAWLLLCGISTRSQDWHLGEKCFGKLTQLRPQSSLAASGLVKSYMNLERYDEALQEIERFKLVADSSNEEAKIVLEEHRHAAELIIAQGKGT